MAESILSRLENVLDGTSKSSQIAAAVAGLGAVYVIKQIFTPSPLACISGPPSPSFLTGHLLALTSGKGDMGYCHNITEKYGGIVKLNALFGVRRFFLLCTWFANFGNTERNAVYIRPTCPASHSKRDRYIL